VEPKEIATISITCNTARDRSQKVLSKTCQYPVESLVPSAVYAHNRAVTRVWLGIVLGPEFLALSSSSPEAHVVLGSYPLTQFDRFLKSSSSIPQLPLAD